MMNPATTENIRLQDARNQLARLWFGGSGLLFMILTIQSIFGKYAEETGQVWSWFVPMVVPTLSLMISVFGSGALTVGERRRVKGFFYELTWWLSLAYLVTLLLTIAGASVRAPATDVLVLSTAWLAPIQGLTVGAIGYLFLSKNASQETRG